MVQGGLKKVNHVWTTRMLAAEGEEEDVCITNIHILLASLRNFLDDGSWPDTNQEFYVPTLKALQILSTLIQIECWLQLQLKIVKDRTYSYHY